MVGLLSNDRTPRVPPQRTPRSGARDSQTPESPFALPGGAFAALILGAAMTPLRETAFGNTNAALLMVVVIAAAASLGGRAAGVVTALTAALSFNFFLTRPYLSVHIADPTDAITVALLVFVGLVIGAFAHRRKRVLAQLRTQTDSTERLERIAQLLVSELTHDQLCEAVAEELREQLELKSARWRPISDPTGLPIMDRTGWVEEPVHRHRGAGFLLPEQGVELPVEFAGARLGAFELVPETGFGVSADQRRVAIALSDLLASALARSSGNGKFYGDTGW
jgi:K+-sensing histidine kinase KdpD